MKKYFTLVVDLLELPEQSELWELADSIQEAFDKQESIFIAHRYGFLLQWRYALLAGKITPEAFVRIGDISSDIPLSWEPSSKTLINSLKNWDIPEASVLIIDILAWKLLLSAQEQENILFQLTKQKKQLIAK